MATRFSLKLSTSKIPAKYNDATGEETSWSATVSDVNIVGAWGCSETSGTSGSLAAAGFTPEDAGTYCYCRITNIGNATRWTLATTNANCSTKCAYFCANNMTSTGSTSVTFRTNLYNAAGIATQ